MKSILGFVAVLPIVSPTFSTAADPIGKVSIVAPAEIGNHRTVTVEGKVTGTGWPVLAVRPIGNGVHPWFIQPAVDQIANGQFECQVFTGATGSETGAFEIRAFLTANKSESRGYEVGNRLTRLPCLSRSEAMIVRRNVSEAWVRKHRIAFSEMNWSVKTGVYGPGPNTWSEENVRVDETGKLHLKIGQHDDELSCAEIEGDDPLGFGEYRWTISGNFRQFHPNVVLGVFLYKDQRNELDFELSKWGVASNDNAQFVVQPPSVGRIHRFDTGTASRLMVSLVWGDGLLRACCKSAEQADAAPIAEWTFRGIVPSEKDELVPHMNLWILSDDLIRDDSSHEVTIESFQFIAK